MINNTTIIGRITKDLVPKMTANGKPTVAFSLAVQRDKDNADFVPCRAYGRTAELLTTYCKKGSQIALNGSLHTYTTESDGAKQYHMEVIANIINFLDKKESTEPAQPSADDELYSIDDADLPF